MKDRLDILSKLLEDEAEKHNQRQQERRARLHHARGLLLEAAQTRLGAYEARVAEKTPEAVERFETVIRPFVEELVDSGVYERIQQWQEKRLGSLRLNDPITYTWPDTLYDAIDKAGKQGQDPFKWAAEDVIKEGTTRKPLEQLAIEKIAQYGRSAWSANIYVPSSDYVGLYITQWPVGGGGCGFHGDRYKRRLVIGKDPVSLPDINPEVFLTFADQVKTGRVFENIEGEIRRRR